MNGLQIGIWRWLFTSRRAAALLAAAGRRTEVRVPTEMLWVVNRYDHGILIIDPEQRTIQVPLLAGVKRAAESYSWRGPHGVQAGVDRPERALRNTRTVLPLLPGGFDLSFATGRFGDSVVIFGRNSVSSPSGS